MFNFFYPKRAWSAHRLTATFINVHQVYTKRTKRASNALLTCLRRAPGVCCLHFCQHALCAFGLYSGDFLKVNHFRRCLALYVRDPRVGNYRVSTCVASRVSRRYHYKPIKSHYQHAYDHTVIVVLAMSAQVVIHQSYYLFIPAQPTQANAGPRGNAFIQSNPLKGTAWVFEPIVWLPARWAKIYA